MLWSVQKRQNVVLFGTFRFVSYIILICLFLHRPLHIIRICLFYTDHYNMSFFFGDFWFAVIILHIHCPKFSHFFEFICYFFEFLFNREHVHLGSKCLVRTEGVSKQSYMPNVNELLVMLKLTFRR
jgi:hypothetical protein